MTVFSAIYIVFAGGRALAQTELPSSLHHALTLSMVVQDQETTAPGVAALTSLVIPGVGQIRQGRKWGWGLMATDLLLIGSGVWARSEGRERQDKYEGYADRHWNRQQYLDYLDYYLGQTGTPWPHDHHTLAPPGVFSHDHYEMIGKYDQFAPGWDDWAAMGSTLDEGTSTHRTSYLDMRWRANRYLKWSLTAGGLVFLNHAFAAVEALIWGKRQQERVATLGLRFSGAPDQVGTTALLTITWRLRR
jgi:hypothetical protein